QQKPDGEESRETRLDRTSERVHAPRVRASRPCRPLLVGARRVRVAGRGLVLARHARVLRPVLARGVVVSGLGGPLLQKLVRLLRAFHHGPPSSLSLCSSASTPGTGSSSSPGSG